MTEKERKEAEKSFRISIKIWKWVFIIYGNWKRNIVYCEPVEFKIYDWHPITPKKGFD